MSARRSPGAGAPAARRAVEVVIGPGNAESGGIAGDQQCSPPGGGPCAEKTVSVLYIAGFGRSGSTLLDRLLGATSMFHSGGEVAGLWSRGLVDDRLCSCGRPFSGCPFWQAVGSASFQSLQPGQVKAIAGYLSNAMSTRYFWRILSRAARRRLVNSAPPELWQATANLYQGMRDAAGSTVVVDSSKLPAYLLLLAHLPSVRLSVVHLVRDPRAVAHSWMRPPTADPDGRSSMPRFGPVKSALLWIIINGSVEWAARSLRLPYNRLRYEDLVKDPALVVSNLRSRVLEDAGLLAEGPQPGDKRNAQHGQVHSISGNPMRFHQGRVTVSEDTSWKDYPASRWRVVTLITFALRWRYGYR